jgi:hypothetical protein
MAKSKKQPDETSAPMANETTAGGTGKVTKTEMVRQAIDEGRKKKPLQIQAWIKEKFGEEIPTNHISTMKSNLKGKSGRKGKPGRKPGPKPAGDSAPRRNSNTLSVEEIRLVKGLVGRIGKEQFRQVVDLLS